jgi:hypothetical protein
MNYYSTSLYLALLVFFFFTFLTLYPIERGINQLMATNKDTEPSMPLKGFEPIAPVFERATIVHGIDSMAIVMFSNYP